MIRTLAILLCSLSLYAQPNIFPVTAVKQAQPLLSPKSAEQQRFVVKAASPSSVFRLTFAWNYPIAVNFTLWYGLAPGQWTNKVPVGMATTFTFAKTNWNERWMRHFYVVRAGTDGPPSNEVHFPPYPPSHVALLWAGKVYTVLFSSDNVAVPISQWPVIATVAGTNRWDGPMTPGARYFAVTNGETLKIVLYNPLNQ